jgi:hypothetical protein
MNNAVAHQAAEAGSPLSVFDEATRHSICHCLHLQASFMAALENTAARAIETGDHAGALEDIERMAGGIKDNLRHLARLVIEVETTRPLSLVKDGHHALAQH